MKMKLKKSFLVYVNSWWIPTAIFFVLLFWFTIVTLLNWQTLVTLSNILFGCMAVAFVGVLCSTGWHFIKRRWKKGLTSLLMILVCGFAAIGAMLFLTGSTMFGPSEDGFAYNFKIPDNLEIAEPLHELNTEPVKKDDGFQIALLLALETPGNNDSTITANIPSLISLQTNALITCKESKTCT